MQSERVYSFKINNCSYTSKTIQVLISKLLANDKEYLNDVGIFLGEWFSDEKYIIVKTSGSTGKPKLIKLLKEHMVNSALATGAYFNLEKNTKALLCLSTNYIAGKMMLIRAIVLGWNIHLAPTSSNPLENLKETFDFCAMVPMQVESSFNKLNIVKNLIIGGAAVSQNLQDKLLKVTTNCYATYGMTETITHIAVKKLNNFKQVDFSNNTSNFKTLNNVFISKDERDCLVINAPKLSTDTVITNDIVKIISNNEFEWLGRYDNVINSGGIKLFPEQIEKKLSKTLSNRFFVIGKKDQQLGEKLVLLIESSTKIELRKSDYLNCNLDKYEMPKEVFFVDKFIETETGKIKRKESLNLI